jgi:NADH-quinone oxidoreductase subunit D
MTTAELFEQKVLEKGPGPSRLVLNFGPQHPATHGTLRIVVELDGERVVRAVPHIGYLHSGFEKIGEVLDYNQYVTITDRMNYMSPLANNIGWHLAVEKLMGVEAPPRAQYIRVVLAELSRIADHLVFLGTHAMDLGAFTVFLWCFREREKCYDLFEMITGARYTNSYTRVGGVAADAPEGFKEKVLDFITHFPDALKEMDEILTRNRIFVERTKGVGTITAEEAISYGLTGPLLRACGVPLDLRLAEPYLVYKDLDFDVPIGRNGDVYDRYLVRMEEMRQSVSLTRQAVEKMPDGPVNLGQSLKVTLPDHQIVYTKMESLIHHFELVMPPTGYRLPVAEVYLATETANGELGFYIVSDGSKIPYRVRVRPPSFINYAAFARMVEGVMLSDLVAILGSINVIAAELDR